MVRSKRRSSSESESCVKITKKRKALTEISNRGNILKDCSVFGELVSRHGIVLKADNKSNELNTDQAVFQRNLTQAIKRHPDFPEVIDEFVDAYCKHIDDPIRFRWSLMPCITPLESESIARGGTQDSLARLLLGIDQLQPKLMNVLLEKLAEYTEDEEVIGDEKVNMPHLIMNQFRWLDRVVNSKELVDKLFEVLGVSSLEVQREIVVCIPEVLDDLQHTEVANRLKELLVQSNELAVPILDALSNLNLGPEIVAEIRGSVVETLPSVELEDLPVIVKFLLQTVSGSHDAYEVVVELRKNLDFQGSFPPESSSTPRSRKSKAGMKPKDSHNARGTQALMLDAIRSAIRFQRSIAEAWIKTIESGKSSGDHKVLDICVLLILHSSNHKKPVEALFRNKIRAGHFTEALLQATFGSHAQVLREYFTSVLSLAEVLLRSPEPAICHMACAMYKHAFSAFDTYCRQEIVGNLVTHIGSGFEGEIDSSLDILVDLVETDITKMTPFAIFVKGVLDYLDNLTVIQIRKLYSMLSHLAFHAAEDSSPAMIQDELYIVIRKQLTNNEPKYRRMGVIGAIMIVKSLAKNSSADITMEQCSGDQSISDEVYQQVVNLLELVKTSTNKTPEAMALFMDEMASVIQRGLIDQKVEGWIGENVIADFQDDYVIDLDNKDTKEYLLPMALQLGLDEENEAIAINLLPIVIRDRDNSHGKITGQPAKCLTPTFRLLAICEKRQHEGDLEGIDALLGCPLSLPKPDTLEKLESYSQKELDVLCDCLFLALNWFREVVNAFASQDDPEMKAKVITRVKNITDVQMVLEKCLAANSKYQPPPANFDVEDKEKLFVKPAIPSRKAPKRKKKDVCDDADETHDTSALDTQQSTTQAEKKEQTQAGSKSGASSPTGEGVDMSTYRGYFRELDMDVFSILSVGLITRAALDTNLNTKDVTTLQIQPPQLQFLLQDLVSKLDHSLIASASKRRTFLKSKGDKKVGFSHIDELGSESIARRALKLLPALCQHLEATNAFFQAQVAANDGVVDGPGSSSEESQLMATCLALLLQALNAIFSWSGFLLQENKGLLKQGLAVLAGRLNACDNITQFPFQELLSQSFHYLENFSPTVPNCAAAVTLCKLLGCLVERADSNDLKYKLGKLSQEFLKREWFAPDGEKEKGAKFNELLQTLLRMYFNNSEDVLGCLENLATVGIPELIEADKNGSSNTYPTLTRNSYPTYYRLVLSELVSVAKSIAPSGGGRSDNLEVVVDRLVQWNMCVRIFHILVNLIKVFDARANLGAVLKHGRIFVETFLRNAMPMLDTMFRSHKDDILSILKNLQLSTRNLHHMCGHSKILKDVSLTNQVPLLKKILETFVYRVKASLAINKCAEAFWLGNLKNRDLRGDEILSQASRIEEDGSDEDESVMPEDSDEEVEVDKESEVSNDTRGSGSDGEEQSYSEVY